MDKFESKRIKLANNTIKKAIAKKDRGLLQHKINKLSLKLIAFSNFSLAKYNDMGTQLGFIILLTDNTKRVNELTYSS